jgi:hypothetical protein
VRPTWRQFTPRRTGELHVRPIFGGSAKGDGSGKSQRSGDASARRSGDASARRSGDASAPRLAPPVQVAATEEKREEIFTLYGCNAVVDAAPAEMEKRAGATALHRMRTPVPPPERLGTDGNAGVSGALTRAAALTARQPARAVFDTPQAAARAKTSRAASHAAEECLRLETLRDQRLEPLAADDALAEQHLGRRQSAAVQRTKPVPTPRTMDDNAADGGARAIFAAQMAATFSELEGLNDMAAVRGPALFAHLAFARAEHPPGFRLRTARRGTAPATRWRVRGGGRWRRSSGGR